MTKIEDMTAISMILDFVIFYQGLNIVTPHMIPFWNPWDYGSNIG